MAPQAYRWVLTLNNYTEDDYKDLCDLPVQYSIIGKEVSATGTPHLQAYFNFGVRNRLRLATVKKYAPKGHWEVAKGNDEQNKAYCSKGSDFIEHGTIITQGQRTDLHSIVSGIKSKRKWNDLVDESPTAVVKYARGLDRLRQHYVEKRDWKTEVLILTGPPGTGKSRWALKNTTCAYWKPSGIWWDGYEYDEEVVIDDFEGEFPYSTFLKICDRYPTQVPTKGGFKEFTARKLIIISNKPWTSWYRDHKHYSREAVERRIDQHVAYNENVPPRFDTPQARADYYDTLLPRASPKKHVLVSSDSD